MRTGRWPETPVRVRLCGRRAGGGVRQAGQAIAVPSRRHIEHGLARQAGGHAVAVTLGASCRDPHDTLDIGRHAALDIAAQGLSGISPAAPHCCARYVALFVLDFRTYQYAGGRPIHGEVGLAVPVVVARHRNVCRRDPTAAQSTSRSSCSTAGRTNTRWTADTRRGRSCRRRRSRPAPACPSPSPHCCARYQHCSCSTAAPTRPGGRPIHGDVGPAVAVVVAGHRDVCRPPHCCARYAV